GQKLGQRRRVPRRLKRLSVDDRQMDGIDRRKDRLAHAAGWRGWSGSRLGGVASGARRYRGDGGEVAGSAAIVRRASASGFGAARDSIWAPAISGKVSARSAAPLPTRTTPPRTVLP